MHRSTKRVTVLTSRLVHSLDVGCTMFDVGCWGPTQLPAAGRTAELLRGGSHVPVDAPRTMPCSTAGGSQGKWIGDFRHLRLGPFWLYKAPVFAAPLHKQKG